MEPRTTPTPNGYAGSARWPPLPWGRRRMEAAWTGAGRDRLPLTGPDANGTGLYGNKRTAMAKTRGTGLLMVWTDIDSEFEAEFNRWYDEEHIARLLEVPGFLSAGRYVAVTGGPKYLAMYELEDHNVLRSAAYLDTVKYQPSPQRAKAGTSRIGRNFLRNPYRQISRYTRSRSSRPWRWLRFSRWGGSTSAPRWRRSSTPGTTRLISRAIWRCRVASAPAGLSPSKASRNI